MTLEQTTPSKPRRAEIRELMRAGKTDEEIAEIYKDGVWGDVSFAIRETRAGLEAARRKMVNRAGPWPVLYVTRDGIPVYDVGGGHAVHGEFALKALCFGPDAPQIAPLEIRKRSAPVSVNIAALKPVAPPEVSDPDNIRIPPLTNEESIMSWSRRVAALNGTTLDSLRQCRRGQKLLRSLRDAMMLAIYDSGRDVPTLRLGRMFGLDHTTVVYTLQKMRRRDG